jgi:hypothetical protein
MRIQGSLVVVAVIAGAGGARADGFYYSEGLGVTTVKDELAAHEADPTMARLRLAVGMRSGPWAVEGSVALALSNDYGYYGADAGSAGLTSTALDLKYLQPLARHLEVYVRGSAGYGWADGNLANYSGRSLGFGAGVQVKGKGSILGLLAWPLFFLIDRGPQMTAALFLDEGYDFYRLHDGSKTAVDAQLTHVTFGVALGTDF